MPDFRPATMEKKKEFEPLPPGEYRIMIHECSYFDASGCDVMNMKVEVLEPDEHKGKKPFLSLFYNDYKLNDLSKSITGKTIAENFPGNDSISQEKVFELFLGEHTKVRLGIKEKNGKKRNEIAEVILEKKKESTASLDV